jgi:hypothetical protein
LGKPARYAIFSLGTFLFITVISILRRSPSWDLLSAPCVRSAVVRGWTKRSTLSQGGTLGILPRNIRSRSSSH